MKLPNRAASFLLPLGLLSKQASRSAWPKAIRPAWPKAIPGSGLAIVLHGICHWRRWSIERIARTILSWTVTLTPMPLGEMRKCQASACSSDSASLKSQLMPHERMPRCTHGLRIAFLQIPICKSHSASPHHLCAQNKHEET